MTDERILEIANQFEAYKDSKVPTLRGKDIVLCVRQAIDEAIQDERDKTFLAMFGLRA